MHAMTDGTEPLEEEDAAEETPRIALLHALFCKGCRRRTRRLFTLLRPPHPPNELRICTKCLPQLKADGWQVMRSFVPLPGGQPHAFACHNCPPPKDDQRFHIVSRTGEPVELERCEECSGRLTTDGWRKACVRGSM